MQVSACRRAIINHDPRLVDTNDYWPLRETSHVSICQYAPGNITLWRDEFPTKLL